MRSVSRSFSDWRWTVLAFAPGKTISAITSAVTTNACTGAGAATCPTLPATGGPGFANNLGTYADFQHWIELGAQWRGTFGDVGLGVNVSYMIAGRIGEIRRRLLDQRGRRVRHPDRPDVHQRLVMRVLVEAAGRVQERLLVVAVKPDVDHRRVKHGRLDPNG